MSFSDNLKGKNLIIVGGAVALLVVVLAVVFFSGPKKGAEGPDVITKRVKINLQEETPSAADQAKPGYSIAKPAVKVETPAGVVTAPGKTTTAPIKVDVAPDKATEAKAPEKKEPPKKEEPKKEPVKTVAEKKHAPVETKEAAPAKTAVKAPAKETAPAKVKTAAAAKPAKAKKTMAAKAAANGGWGLNVASFTNNLDAGNLKSRLKAAGYNAYVTEFTKDTVKWYRVRVGFFKTKAEATSASKKIRQKFRVQSPWIFKPAKDEITSAG